MQANTFAVSLALLKILLYSLFAVSTSTLCDLTWLSHTESRAFIDKEINRSMYKR